MASRPALLAFVHALWLALATPAGCATPHEPPARQAPDLPSPRAVLPLPSLDFASPDANWEALLSWVGDAQVVLLGEAHHGDAQGIRFTARVVRLLHERAGFDVLALEADMYGCDLAQRTLEAEGSEALLRCAHRAGGRSAAAQPLWTYLAGRAHGPRPIEVVGIDCQPSSEGARTQLLLELEPTVRRGSSPLLDGPGWQAASQAIHKLMHYQARATVEERARDADALAALSEALRRAQPSTELPEPRLRFLRQLARSLAADEAQEWAFQHSEPLGDGYHESFNLRDAQMAENLLFHHAERPGRRMIVWTASAHLARSLASIPVSSADEAARYVPMGKHVARALGSRALHVAMLHHAGMLAQPGDAPFALSAPPPGFVEHELQRRGFGPATVFDVRAQEHVPAWLSEPRPARWYLTRRPPLAVAERPRDVADLVVYIERTEPNVAALP